MSKYVNFLFSVFIVSESNNKFIKYKTDVTTVIFEFCGRVVYKIAEIITGASRKHVYITMWIAVDTDRSDSPMRRKAQG